MNKSYHVIGLMSGTSLDGLDLAYCEFNLTNGRWSYTIHQAETIPYSSAWRHRLSVIETGSAVELVSTDVEFGHLLGSLTAEFIRRHNLSPDFIASHGHTIFHQPHKRYTCQIGNGAAISSETGKRVVCDFRTLDVALGGQGAPLVPVGDELLFGDYDYCLNIGGIANISYAKEGQRIAYDICPANMLLNKLANAVGQECDLDGKMAALGNIQQDLLEKLNSFSYFDQAPPKSLGKEWIAENVFPLLENRSIPVNTILATACEHIAIQIARNAPGTMEKRMLITGGGALNKFLISRLNHYARIETVIPDSNTVNFKEALIFAFLGVLRWRNEVNCLKSVTGASMDSSGGAIY